MTTSISALDEVPPSIEEISEGIFVIECDASFNNGIAGVCCIIKTAKKEYKPKERSYRSKGPNEAEMKAILFGLKEVKKIRKPLKEIRIYTDNQLSYNVFKRGYKTHMNYLTKVVKDINPLLEDLKKKEVRVVWIKTRTKHIRRADNRSKKTRKVIEKKKQGEINDRINKVNKANERSKNTTIIERDGKYYTDKGYEVCLYPPECECKHWRIRWGEKEENIIRARALPCKHMCALASHLGLDIYEIFKKQINRVD